MLENSAVVKEIKRKEEIANLSGVYFFGPLLTGIILMVMMYSLSAVSNTGAVAFIAAALLSNFFTMCVFKEKIARLKRQEEDFQRQMKKMKIVMAGTVIIMCVFIVALHFI